ncbi:glycosyltransferase [Ovoidimarina sediminis]|uniref:glycosyltransferase n=1 Tax=Ovoidimarina sediminis TaxID=3079856 RepID=UPI00290E4B84|nr:glycosyltransferase [Rhodophyticola sp. MJ-SS7]MDU8942110.1 glycosyltransferase [Rhodophyticola sp. MJ-SS7]
MIFVTTGTQLPFPRLIAEMDRLAFELEETVVAQVGPDDAERPNLDLRGRMSPEEFEATFKAARLVVAHAGVGSVLSARRYGKPLILVPRRFSLGEHRNDHQFATAQALDGREGIYVAWEVDEIGALVRRTELRPAEDRPGPELQPLVSAVRNFLLER